MKIAHRVPAAPWFAEPESDPVDDEYAAAVERATERSEREYRQVQERLVRAERRLATARARKADARHRKRIKQLEALVNARRAELAEYERLMAAPIVASDKQIRQRSGLDDHLELGIRKHAARSWEPSGPVVTRKVGKQ